MNSQSPPQPLYGSLCSLYYDLKEGFAPAQELDFYARFMHPDHATLEAMSGSGRLQIPLLQRGFRVEGIDNSPVMLNRCRQHCAQLHLDPQLYLQDIEQISLPTCYHTVIIAMGSFQLIADKQRALTTLQRLHAHMHYSGMLLIDFFTPDRALDNQWSTDTITLDQHQTLRFSAQYVFNEREPFVQAFCAYELLIDGTIQRQEREIMNFIWYTDNELILLLTQAGFETIAIHEEQFRSSGLSRIVQAKPILPKNK